MQVKQGIYQHYKGQLYQVFHVATHSETGEKVVVYQCLYDDYSMWVRPLEMFMETVEIDGEVIPRFKLIQETH
ncbi:MULTISPECIES: DUF1653 domain-containing protein [unclassified Acinetobacter]|uniref:DUF1653 domain-containing protein n=1 Tax=unclassified Acinetobacter TaxID=196816 RepID=UPI000DD01EEF|nr:MULTISPECIES: DUF1653 domain-containing protein [unclassified Acinetobacter]